MENKFDIYLIGSISLLVIKLLYTLMNIIGALSYNLHIAIVFIVFIVLYLGILFALYKKEKNFFFFLIGTLILEFLFILKIAGVKFVLILELLLFSDLFLILFAYKEYRQIKNNK